MADTWGVSTQITILPKHVTLFIETTNSRSMTFLCNIGHTNISFNRITQLSRISWEVVDNHINVTNARQIFDQIIDINSSANKWWILFAVSCANGAFCRLFSGDMAAATVVCCATLGGYYFKQILLSCKIDIRLVFIICSFVSSILACADELFGFGKTPQIAIATSVLYLVPGIPFLNSFSDMLDRHYICFFSRFTDAIVLTCCLSIGLCAGMWVMEIGMF